MATDGRFGLPLIKKGGLKKKKLFLGVFAGLLQDHNHYETGLNKREHFGGLEGTFGLQME